MLERSPPGTGARRRPAAGMVLLAAIALAGCSAGQCDPAHDNNIFTVGGCVMGGGYSQRVDAQTAAARNAEAEQYQAAAAAQAAERRRQAAVGEQARLRRIIADERGRSARLQNDIAQARAHSDADRQRLAQLRQDVARLHDEQMHLNPDAVPSPALSLRVDDLRRRGQNLERQWNALSAAVPAD
jgi:chromosome segregation ATPase